MRNPFPRIWTSVLVGILTLSVPLYPQSLDQLVDIETAEIPFILDIRYSTEHNFLEEILYQCAKCYLLPEVAKALVNAQYYFCDLGYSLVLYDCYRPVSVQYKMWNQLPGTIYVANPQRGSVHNRGAAVDLTLVTRNGDPVDMGTDYDFFGRAAHTDNFTLAEEILKNRELLQTGMKTFGFSTIQSEWWHFNFLPKARSPLLDIPFQCE